MQAGELPMAQAASPCAEDTGLGTEMSQHAEDLQGPECDTSPRIPPQGDPAAPASADAASGAYCMYRC